MNISVFIYNILAPIISPTVSMLFNNSLSEGTFPECFKTAKIIQILKSGDSNSTVNYRPISMLTLFSKIFEKLMCARLDSYLKSNNILCANKFGIRKIQILQTQFIELIDYVHSSLDSKESTIAVYLDFSKAFDTLIITYWWVSSCIMASEVSCSTGLSLIWVIGNNTSQ